MLPSKIYKGCRINVIGFFLDIIQMRNLLSLRISLNRHVTGHVTYHMTTHHTLSDNKPVTSSTNTKCLSFIKKIPQIVTIICVSLVFMHSLFKTCAAQSSGGQPGLAPYLKMFVAGMLVIWQSFMLLSKNEQFDHFWVVSSWTILS